MQRVLVIRLLALELGPIVAALLVSAYREQFMAQAFFAASLLIFVSVLLSIRDGAVLERWGYVCEKRKDPRWFWLWLAAHFCFGLFCLAGATMIFFWPTP